MAKNKRNNPHAGQIAISHLVTPLKAGSYVFVYEDEDATTNYYGRTEVYDALRSLYVVYHDDYTLSLEPDKSSRNRIKALVFEWMLVESPVLPAGTLVNAKHVRNGKIYEAIIVGAYLSGDQPLYQIETVNTRATFDVLQKFVMPVESKLRIHF